MIHKLLNRSLIIALIVFSACNGNKDRFSEAANGKEIPPVPIQRYGRALFAIEPSQLKPELQKLQASFPVFLDADLSDSNKLKQVKAFISDTFLIRLNIDCLGKYPNLENLENDLHDVLGRFHYFFPDVIIPTVYTYISGLDYEHRIQYYKDNLIIALDMYLGKDYASYKKLGLPEYVLRHFEDDFLIRDCIYSMGQGQVYQQKIGDKLLDRMINEGKLLWFVHLMIPDLDEKILLDYSAQQLQWAKDNETMAWAFIIENKMLYSPNSDFTVKWIRDAPFTSYFGPDSPPRLGMWIGYRIVNAFMNRNSKVSPGQLMQIYDAQKILKLSHFKPEQK